MIYTHIKINHGYVSFEGKDVRPDPEVLDLINKMAEIAYNNQKILMPEEVEIQFVAPKPKKILKLPLNQRLHALN